MITLAATALITEPAQAETPRAGIRIDQMQPAPPESAFFRAEGPHEPDPGGVEFAAGLTVDYGKGVLKASRLDTAGNTTEAETPIEHALLLHVGGSITPIHWLTLDFSLPFGLLEKGEIADGGQVMAGPTALVRAPQAQGLGDLRVGLHLRPVDTKAFGLILGGRFWAPFGSDDAYLSDKSVRAEVDLGFAGEGSSVLYGCTLSAAPTLFAGRDGDRAAASCALHIKTGAVFSIGVEPTVALFNDLDKYDERSIDVLFEPMAAARIRTGGLRVGFGVGPGFGGAAGTGEVRGLFSLAYVGKGRPEKPAPAGPADSDLDEILDSQDACPNEAGPTSADPAQRGCPARDRDADGVRDGEDHCPERAGVQHKDVTANGCPDTDNDLLPDPIDGCKDEPGPAPEGCPRHARLTRDSFKISPPIGWDRVTLNAGGRAAFEEIAATMRANPKIEQVSVTLGTKGASADTSDKRAKQILVILGNNLDSNRFEVVLREDLKAGVVEIRLIR